MKPTNWRDGYFYDCGRHGIPLGIATKILRHSNTVQRAAEVECSVSAKNVRSYWKARDKAAQIAILDALDCLNRHPHFGPQVGATLAGDPRGAVVKIVGYVSPDRKATTFEIAVPSCGFTGAQIERMSAVS